MDVHVTLDGPRLRLVSEGVEIGDWGESMYSLAPAGGGAFILSAENDELTFRPDSPEEFAIAIADARSASSNTSHGLGQVTAHVIREGPRAGALTMILFYLLAAGTLALGVWAAMALVAGA